MKRFFLLMFISLIIISWCSKKDNKNIIKEQQDFNIDEYSENFELDFEDINTNKVKNELPKDTSPKKFEKFEDKDIWFSFLYPDNNNITKNLDLNPIKIQNYKTWEKVLNIWDFYIEIFYLENNLNCEDKISEITSIYENKWITINRWFWKEEWNIWWTKYALCFKKWEKLVYISYTENWNIYVNTIFNSLQID
jgi:hypothetical protein